MQFPHISLPHISVNFSTVAATAAQAADILGKSVFFVQSVEAAAATIGGVPGAQKLEAVKSALAGYIDAKFPDIAPQFAALWTEVAAIISGLVTAYHAIGFFVKLAKAA